MLQSRLLRSHETAGGAASSETRPLLSMEKADSSRKVSAFLDHRTAPTWTASNKPPRSEHNGICGNSSRRVRAAEAGPR